MPRRRLLTMAQYAAHRGVTTSAVSQALRKGRLSGWSVGWDVRRQCYRIDPARADWEWQRNTYQDWGGRR
jgi:hypothetical protein